MMSERRYVMGPQDHCQVQQFARTQRTQHGVVLAAMISYSKRIQNKIRKEKRYMGRGPEKTTYNLLRSSPSGVLTIPAATNRGNTCEMLFIREAPSTEPVSRFLTPGRHTCIPHKPQHFHKEVRHSEVFLSGNYGNLKSEFLGSSQRPIL